MLFRQIRDDKLAQYAYLIGGQQANEAVLVDPQRDVDRYLEAARHEGVRITAVAETHIHADFLSGARELVARDPGIALYLSDEGADWKYEWARGGAYRVHFLHDGDAFAVGGVELRAIHTPGHTPEHLSFLVTDRGGGATEPMGMVTGDFVFVGDLGRPDLLESASGVEGKTRPAARRLYESARRVLELTDHLQIWPGHGAGSACGKALGAVPRSTLGYERRSNTALQAVQGSEDRFVDFILAGQPEPSLYFARMKQLNKSGVPVLGELPSPRELGREELAALAGRSEVTVLDTRPDRRAFFAGHLAGSIFAPLDRTFPTIAGSYVDPDLPLYLVVQPEKLDEAVRDLIHVGLDRVVGFASPETLSAAGDLAATRSIDIRGLERRAGQPAVGVLDVRSAAEHASGHVPGAVNLPHTRLPARLREVPACGEVLVHCGSGARAASAVSLLEREGFRVTHVDGAFAGSAARADR